MPTSSQFRPQYLSGDDIRRKFLDFYVQRHHQELPSASLVPDDPTVLLTIAGMLQFKPIFLGQRSASYARATTSQKCIRTNDIENVGRTKRHHTFFEMLGNFSFGDYFKAEAIQWAWELSTEVFGLPPERLVPSVFREDDEAFAIWRDKIGVPAHRIQRLGEADNFWAAGPTGPCGPCSEIYYDFHPEHGDDAIDLEDDTRFIEFYNLVFMQYNRDREGNLTPLQTQNIDTGMGLERMAQILQDVPNNYETDLILPIIKTAAAIANIDFTSTDDSTQTSLKVIGDHVRAIVHLIADGVSASNLGRGYIMRRLLRRVVRHGRAIGITTAFITQVAETAIDLAAKPYPNVRDRADYILGEIEREEAAFFKTLERGEAVLAAIVAKTEQTASKQIDGRDAFDLYATYGYPVELTQEAAEERGLTVDMDGFDAAMNEHREQNQAAHETIDLTAKNAIGAIAASGTKTQFLGYREYASPAQVMGLVAGGRQVERAAAGTTVQIVLDSTPFYAESGGQIGDRGYLSSDDVLVRVEDVQKEGSIFVHHGRVERGTLELGTLLNAQIDRSCRRRAQAHHTATHLLQAALKQMVDPAVSQAGSLVAFDRLRFDFNCPRAIAPEELQQIEEQINTWIAEAHDTQAAEMAIADAKAKGAVAMFGEKYGDVVRVIDVPGVSMELCGGTHVNNTAEIGLFKIVSETGISSGVRRIEAVAGPAVLEYLNVRDDIVRDLSDRFKVKPEEVLGRVDGLQSDLKSAQKQLETLKRELALAKSDSLLDTAETVGAFQVLVANMGELDAESLKTAAERLQQKLGESAVVLGSVPAEGKVSLVAAFAAKIINEKKLQAGKFIGGIAKLCGGGGGGRPNLAQAGGREPTELPKALATAKQQLLDSLQ
ncbi:alanine--tRNA ligase [Rubidibacter lacunae KORDI 51-2]|uniref:Alanine--tRNA ligase n=1 Tax=Rubidibacter lacunae KORDI 51-2 TaxID=582515 RepID=U5DNP3_9CHRO|nr:alanine--tRNA ligase [Rubidibacter lacunae]ERN42487.1 alanine--tRNA ligase [Rubidibacter lacunae KORDI 51-2]